MHAEIVPRHLKAFVAREIAISDASFEASSSFCAHAALRLAATMPMSEEQLQLVKEPNEESFWQTFAGEFMDNGKPGPYGLFPEGMPWPYHTLGPLRWGFGICTHDNVEKLRQLLDAQTNPDAVSHALEMLLWMGTSSNPPLRCLRECVYVRGARDALRFAKIRAEDGLIGVADMRAYENALYAPGVLESLRAWRVAYLWRKVRAFCRLRHQLINLYECVCTPERVDFAADLAAATDGLYAT